MIRLAHVSKSIVPGGSEQLMVRTLGLLDPALYDLSCLYWEHDERMAEVLLHTNTRLVRLANANPMLRVLQTMRAVRQGRFDVVHIHSPLMGSNRASRYLDPAARADDRQ